MMTPSVQVVYADGTKLVWYPGEEIDATVECIESFLGPADDW